MCENIERTYSLYGISKVKFFMFSSSVTKGYFEGRTFQEIEKEKSAFPFFLPPAFGGLEQTGFLLGALG